MKIEQRKWTKRDGWVTNTPKLREPAQLVFVFGSTSILRTHQYYYEIKNIYPKAHILGCSTAGEICGTQVLDNSLTTTAISFEYSSVKVNSVKIGNRKDSTHAGEDLAAALEKKGLSHVFVISDGLIVNGSTLVKGLTENLPGNVPITGGLAGDGDRFEETLVLCDAPAERNRIVALCLYGERLKVGYGSMGGWDPFGPERLITRSQENILYELDGKSALELYKTYLGEHAKGLPATGLLFPLSIRLKDGHTKLVRTILSINEEDKGMVFAGDVPEGSYAQFMKANINRLIDGAVGAAKLSNKSLGESQSDLAILISCVGRKMVLKQRVEEEVEGAQDILGHKAILTGFYSYGEISPASPGAACELHNQTMTITSLLEK